MTLHRFGTAAILALASLSSAQSLVLTTQGGSFPGQLKIQAAPGPSGFTGVVLLSGTTGPTPLAALGDPRSLQLGLDAFSNPYFLGSFGPTQAFVPPPVPIPNDPAFLDAAIYFQALSSPGTGSIIGLISNPTAVRFSYAAAARDRGNALAVPRAFGFGEFLPDGRWMYTGGGQGTLVSLQSYNTTEIYDPITDAWSAGPTMVKEHGVHRTAKLTDGRILVAGGFDGGATVHGICEVWSPASNTFTQVGSLAKTRFGHTATLLPNGKVLIAGGIEQLDLNNPILTVNNALKETELFDPVTNTFSAGPLMRDARAAHWAEVLPNGKVLLAGGIGWRSVLGVKIPWIFKDCDLYDPVANTIATGPAMVGPRSIFDMVAIGGGRYLAAGGIASVSLQQPGIPTAACEIYDANTNAWSLTGSLSSGKALGFAFPLGGGKVVQIGGGIGSITSPAAVDETEIWDPATGQWALGAMLNYSRVGYAGTLLATGQILIAGGGTGAGTQITNTVEFYYP